MRFAVVDVETSGLSPGRHRLLQVGVVGVDGSSIVDEWQSKIKLRWPWQRVGPRRVHGIGRADLRRAPELPAVMRQLAERVDGRVLVAHNLDFDTAFLHKASDVTGVALHPSHQICTLMLSRQLDPERELRHGLGDLADRYGVVNAQPHDALHDAMTTALILPHLLDAADIRDDADIARLEADQSEYRDARR